MPKMKTNKAASKRFRVTSTGKYMRGHQMTSHLKTKKSSARLRRQQEPVQVDGGQREELERLLPYGQS